MSRKPLSSDLLVVTNNPLVWQKAADSCAKVDGKALDVLYECLNLIAKGHALYTYPISGNARLLHNPYRTVIMERAKDCPMARMKRDIKTLEYYLEKMEPVAGAPPPETLADYRLVDYELYLGMSDFQNTC